MASFKIAGLGKTCRAGAKGRRSVDRKYVVWIWPALVSALVLTGFAIRGSDLPAPAAALVAAFALLGSISYALKTQEIPPLPERRDLLKLLIVLGVFCFAVFVPLIVEGSMSPTERGFIFYDPSAAWLEGIKMAGVICAFALGFRCSLNDEGARRMLDLLLYTGGAWAAISICMQLLDPSGIYGVAKFGAGRLTGAFSSPNSAGTLFGALSVMALARVISRLLTNRMPYIIERIDPAMAAVFLLSLAALMLTLSRGAIVATFISIIGVSFVLLRGRVPVLGLIGGAVVTALVGAVIFLRPLAQMVGRFDKIDGDADVRAIIFTSHLADARHHPWFGSGLGSFNSVNTSIIQATNYQELSVIRSAHNVYLQWFEETGVVGLGSLIALNLAILIPLFQAARQRRQMGGRVWAILFGYLVFLLHGFTDYGFQEPALAMFVAVLLGCGFGLSTNTSRRDA